LVTHEKYVKKFVGLIAIIITITVALASTVSATPYCQPCPYDCDDIGLGNKDCSELPGRGGACCVDLTKKGLELAQQQSSVDDEEDDDEECPDGFEESEDKCTSEERAEGCKDIRLDNGTGCVSR
jgi:hypothetical protein